MDVYKCNVVCVTKVLPIEPSMPAFHILFKLMYLEAILEAVLSTSMYTHLPFKGQIVHFWYMYLSACSR